MSGPFSLSDMGLSLPWKDMTSHLFPDPADFNATRLYRFSEYDASRFDKSQVIIQSDKTLHKGGALEGYLLALDCDLIPTEIRHGERDIAKLTIFDQFDQWHSNDLFLLADRSAVWMPKQKARRSLQELLNHPDTNCERYRVTEVVVK